MLVLVDTNVLLRVIEPRHPDHASAVTAVRRLRETGCELCLVPQVHYEFWVVATRPTTNNGLGMSASEAEQALIRFGPPWFRLLRDERAVYNCWRDLVTRYNIQGKQAHDARLVAAMIRHGVASLITFNITDFARYDGISSVDPRTAFAP
ncbi:MAG: type II toxin-antitoxin system VapC family toxin [Pirellulales bacterium]|nr:type II toxin-antitoxin system VapC family toxin [Pirellulales bacterium]